MTLQTNSYWRGKTWGRNKHRHDRLLLIPSAHDGNQEQSSKKLAEGVHDERDLDSLSIHIS